MSRIELLQSTKEAAMNQNTIQSDPSIMMGKLVIKGTRITVQSILERFAAEETESQILEAFPR